MAIPSKTGEGGGGAEERKPEGRATPTNYWDFGIYALQILGSRAPLLVIAAAIVFAVYMFIEQERRAETERRTAVNAATATLQQQVNDAHKALVDTYGSMADINQKQIKNLDLTIDLQTKAADATRKLQQEQERLKAELDKSRSMAATALAEKSKAEEDLRNLAATLDNAVATLAAIGTLVDTAPELLRAVATTDAVQNILQKSDQLLAGQITKPELRYRKVQILLAFADLQAFVGAPDKQEKLARAALQLIGDLRTANEAPVGIDGDEAAAHVALGSALGAQNRLETSVGEVKDGIRLFDVALRKDPADPRAVQWRKNKGTALELLGNNTYLWQERSNDSIPILRTAADLFESLKSENPDDPERQIAVAWAHMQIADVERNEQNLDTALREYDLARELMRKVGDKVYRSNEWLNHFARIYNGRALVLLERVGHQARGLQNEAGSAKDKPEIGRTLDEALDDVTKARALTEMLARDQRNPAWQSVHAWSLHNLGEVKLMRGELLLVDSDLDESASTFRLAVAIREKLHELAPASSGWKTDLRWTQINLNEAEANRARRKADYNAMRDLFDRNVRLVGEQLNESPQSDDWHYQQEANRASYADALVLLKQDDKAREIYQKVRVEAAARKSGAVQRGAKDRWEQLVQRVEKAAEPLATGGIR